LAAKETLAAAVTATATTKATTMMATVTAAMTTPMTGTGGRWQPLTAWCREGVRRPEGAEMGIKWKWEQCGYDQHKFLFSKIVVWVYFYSYPAVFPIY
jgi:hypothetical protein